MKLLLDTATLLWSYLQKSRLSAAASKAILDESNEIYVSAASYWEIAIKVSIGKLSLADPISEFVRIAVDENGYSILPILPAHAERVISLAFHHKDPFDRILVAQALVEGMALVSPDQTLDRYGVNRLW